MGQPRQVHVNITFRNTDATDALKKYTDEKISNCLKKYIHHDTDANAVLSVEKNRHIAEVSFNVDGASFSCSEESGDLYASIDRLVGSLSNQLRKHKEKLTSHH